MDGAKLREDTLELFLVPRERKVGHEEVAFLVLSLLSQCLLLLFNFSLRLFNEVTNIEFLSGWSSFELLFMEFVNSFLCALRSVLFIDPLRVIVADHSDLSEFVLHQAERLDFSEGLEHILDLILWVVHWDVLDVDNVYQLFSVLRLA